MKNFPARRILKGAAVISGFFSFAYFISQFLTVAAILDVSLWNSVFANLALITIINFVVLFAASFVLLMVIWLPVNWWRKRYPAATAIPVEDHRENAVSVSNIIGSPGYRFKYETLFIAGLSAFLYLLYLVGRTYYASYLLCLGVPKGIVDYRLDDYVYFGAQIDTLIIVATYTVILIEFIMFWFRKNELANTRYSRWDFWVGFVYLVYFILILSFFAFITVFRSDLDNVPTVILAILMACAGTAIFSIILLQDKGILLRIAKGTLTRNIFVASVIITILVFPYMSAKAWGSFKGITAKIDTFPQVELCATRQVIDGIQWQPTGNGTFRSTENLYLLIKTDDCLILKSATRSNDIYVVKLTDILSAKVSAPFKGVK